MNLTQICEKEQQTLNRFQLLSHSFKMLGWSGLIISVLAVLFFHFIMEDAAILLSVAAKMVLVFMLLISVSKEKQEDEMIQKLRVQSYSIAFILGVIYALAMPVIDFAVDFVINMDTSYSEMSSSIVLWFMLAMQIAFFQLLKKVQS
ncbi:hypothetical protein [Bernardetia sp.]|uniref:hypothetical protein n=1 Tax=Bernardetia sp. TaxID=1937974 RepID=UPI0025BCCE99|nr:hypothetical protein [Bernardetia sp.]